MAVHIQVVEQSMALLHLWRRAAAGPQAKWHSAAMQEASVVMECSESAPA